MSDSRELLRLVTLPRGNDERPEQLRISLDEVEADDGKQSDVSSNATPQAALARHAASDEMEVV